MADETTLGTPFIKMEQIELDLSEDAIGMESGSYALPSTEEEATNGHLDPFYMEVASIPTENSNSPPSETETSLNGIENPSKVKEPIFGEWKSSRTWKLVSEKTESQYTEATRLARLPGSVTCPLCDTPQRKNFMRVKIHIRQHFTLYACICGMVSRSRDTVAEHQRSQGKDNPDKHGGEWKFIYEADEPGYTTLRNTIIPKLPKNFPGCLPTVNSLPSLRNNAKRRKRKIVSSTATNKITQSGSLRQVDQYEQTPTPEQTPTLEEPQQAQKSLQQLRGSYDTRRQDLDRIEHVLALLKEDLNTIRSKAANAVAANTLSQLEAGEIVSQMKEEHRAREKDIERITHLLSLLKTDLTNIGLELAEAELKSLQE